MKFSHIAGLALMAASMAVAAPDPNFHIYIAFGQSNMEGQGDIEAQDKTVDSRFQVLPAVGNCSDRKLGEWTDAVPPLAHCNGAKLGPTDYFGRTMVEKTPEGIKIGVIVVAVGGASIQLFEKNLSDSYMSTQAGWFKERVEAYGGNPYNRIIEMGKKAQEAGVIKGIIFHQGETDNGSSGWTSQVKAVYDNIVKDLGLGDDIPFLAGEVFRGNSTYSGALNAINQLPQQSKNFYVVSSEGFNQALGDGMNVHFTSQEYRDFGKRYAEKMLEVLGEIKVEGGEAPVSSSSEAAPASSDASAGSSSAKADAPASSSAVESSGESASSSSDVAPASSSEAAPQSSSGTDGVKVSSLKAASVGKVRFVENLVQVPVVLDRAARVNVGIYSVLGKRVASFDSLLKAGENSVSFDRKMLPAGNYMMSVQVGSERSIVKVNIPR